MHSTQSTIPMSGSTTLSPLSHSFIHSFIYSHYPRVQLPAASHYLLILFYLLFSLLCCLFQLASLVLSSSAFYSHSPNCFVFLMNSTVCFIICGWSVR